MDKTAVDEANADLATVALLYFMGLVGLSDVDLVNLWLKNPTASWALVNACGLCSLYG